MTTVPPVILVVEDDPDIAQMLDTLLALDGYTVALARTGTEAIAQLHQGLPDLVLTDLHLPQGDGWSVYQHLRALPHGHAVPCLVLTAYDGEITRVDDPAFCLIVKPFHPPALFACLRTLLQRSSRAPTEADEIHT